MNIIITENQYKLLIESESLVSSLDGSLGNLAVKKHVPYGNFGRVMEGRPWFVFLIFEKSNTNEILDIIKKWKTENDVNIFISNENKLKDSNHRHGLEMYKKMKDYVGYGKIASKFNNPSSMGVFISPKGESLDLKNKVLYHTSKLPDLEIKGLVPRNLNMKYKNRLYFWGDLKIARKYGESVMDDGFYIYEVNLDGYKLYKDPEEDYEAYFINLPVNADRVKLEGNYENKFHD